MFLVLLLNVFVFFACAALWSVFLWCWSSLLVVFLGCWPFLDLLSVCLLRSWLFSWGVGLSLAFLSVYSLRPCAGQHLLSLPPQRK
jgi:hypothetical protein